MKKSNCIINNITPEEKAMFTSMKTIYELYQQTLMIIILNYNIV